MLSSILSLSSRSDTPAANSNDDLGSPARLESRRQEIRALLESIRAPAPTPTDVIEVVEQVGAGSLDEVGLDRIAAGIRSLYRAG